MTLVDDDLLPNVKIPESNGGVCRGRKKPLSRGIGGCRVVRGGSDGGPKFDGVNGAGVAYQAM